MDEVKRLSSLVDEFEKPFHPDPLVLKDYKKVGLTAAHSHTILLQPTFEFSATVSLSN